MAFSIAYPLINGHRYAYQSIEVRMNGSPIPTPGLKSINWSEELEAGDVYGTTPHKIGRTRGKHNAMCDFEMYLLEWENFKATLGALGVGYGETPFDYVVSFADLGAPTLTYTIAGNRVTKTEFSNAEGTEATVVKVTCNTMLIISPGGGSIVNPFRT
jgi:hypothetical protein